MNRQWLPRLTIAITYLEGYFTLFVSRIDEKLSTICQNACKSINLLAMFSTKDENKQVPHQSLQTTIERQESQCRAFPRRDHDWFDTSDNDWLYIIESSQILPSPKSSSQEVESPNQTRSKLSNKACCIKCFLKVSYIVWEEGRLPKCSVNALYALPQLNQINFTSSIFFESSASPI